MDDYLSKPVESKAFDAAINRLDLPDARQ